MFRLPCIALLLCISISISFAQDSAKKQSPAKPISSVKYKTGKYHYYKYHTAKPDSGAKAPAYNQAATLKPDTTAAAPATDKSLNGQYQYLLTKIYRYQQPLVSEFWKSASDTLTNSRQKLKEAEGKILAQSKIIDSLKSDSATKAQNLIESSSRTIDIAGIKISLTTYNLVVWGFVLALGITVFVIIARSGSYRNEARYRIELYKELEDEFKAYKTKANDKEKKLARELQTERNKLDDLLGRK